MKRRVLVCSAAAAVAAGAAGCVDDVVDSLPEEVPDGDGTDTGSPSTAGEGPSPTEVVETMFDAVSNGDTDTQEQLIHEASGAEPEPQAPMVVDTVERRDPAAAEAVDERDLEAMRERLGVDSYALVYAAFSDQSTDDGDQEQVFVLVEDQGSWYLYDNVQRIPTADDGTQQDDAEGTESTEQEAATSLQVLSEVGTVEDDSLQTVRLTVRLSPGGGEIDLREVSLDVEGRQPLQYGDTVSDDIDAGTLGATEFVVVPQTGDGPVLSPSSDRASLVFDAGPLTTGDEVTVTLTTAAGEQTTVLDVPDALPPDAGGVRL